MRLQFAPYTLDFRNPAGTSRGVLNNKITAFLKIFDESNPSYFGIGEAAIFPGLSPEADERYFYKMVELVTNVRLGIPTDLSHFPSIQCGFEQALLDFSNGGKRLYYPSPFTRGEQEIEINGLIWMGRFDEMKTQIDAKIDEGFRCIKLKIGAIDWENEVKLLQYIRNSSNGKDIELRVDANGAFTEENVWERLETLASLNIHSIEQPVRQGQPDLLARICKESPVAIALDEELIGKFTTEQRIALLDRVMPQYIVLKPSLIGGFNSSEEWIQLANEKGIGWWVTSALESNIGLNALSQWTATLNNKMPQGLGTGGLFLNNFQTPIRLQGDHLHYDPHFRISDEEINRLDWRD